MHKASYQIYTSQQPAINVKANFYVKRIKLVLTPSSTGEQSIVMNMSVRAC